MFVNYWQTANPSEIIHIARALFPSLLSALKNKQLYQMDYSLTLQSPCLSHQRFGTLGSHPDIASLCLIGCSWLPNQSLKSWLNFYTCRTLKSTCMAVFQSSWHTSRNSQSANNCFPVCMSTVLISNCKAASIPFRCSLRFVSEIKEAKRQSSKDWWRTSYHVKRLVNSTEENSG